MAVQDTNIEKIRMKVSHKRKKIGNGTAENRGPIIDKPNTRQVILQAFGVVKSYKMGNTKLQVLKGADFEIDRGQFVAIVGASGSGKSTLLHILGGLDRPDDGRVEFNSNDISMFSSGQMNKFRNKKVGFVFQFYHLLDELTVLENILLPAMASASVLGWLGRRGRAKTRAIELLEMVGLADRAKQKSFQLSGGERQRVAICRALMNDPEILLADEPTGNLDTEAGNAILSIFERLNKDGQTIVMVTHDNFIAQKAHRIATLVDGKIKKK